MQSFALKSAGVTESGIPAFHFAVEMRPGEDLNGKFNIQFGAAEKNGEVSLVINSPRGVIASFDREASVELSEALADTGEYIVLVDYENVEWDEYTAHARVLMGRDFGQAVDYRERHQFSGQNMEVIQQIRTVVTES